MSENDGSQTQGDPAVTNQTGSPEQTNPPADAGNRDYITEANAAAARLEEANKERAKLLEREERLFAQQRLAGRSHAGQQPAPPKEQTAKEYSQKIMSGEVPQ